jgi:myo-inositol-1(or 4)-monophosphatase
MFPEPLQQLTHIVRETADRILPPLFGRAGGERKADGSLLTDADIRMQDALSDALQRCWPEHAMLGEEMDAATQQRALQHLDTGVWCMDPLDGTSNFAAGVPYYAVSVALLRNGRIEMGTVFDPGRGECFAACRNQGAWLNGEPLEGRRPDTPLERGLALIDLKRLPTALAARLAARPPYKSQRNFGSVALEWCWLAAGRCHVYLHGRQQLWDYAAGHLILEEAGGRAVTLEGEPVYRPSLAPRSAVAALDPAIFAQWCRWLEIPLSH